MMAHIQRIWSPMIASADLFVSDGTRAVTPAFHDAYID
jgi:hypothetical protein